MGILIAPIVLLAIMMIIVSISLTVIAFKNKQFNKKSVISSALISFGILVAIFIFYARRHSAWGLEPYFIYPICMVYVPFGVAMLLKMVLTMSRQKDNISDKLLLSIVFSTILFFVFYDFTFNIIDTLGLQKIY